MQPVVSFQPLAFWRGFVATGFQASFSFALNCLLLLFSLAVHRFLSPLPPQQGHLLLNSSSVSCRALPFFCLKKTCVCRADAEHGTCLNNGAAKRKNIHFFITTK